MTSTTGWRSSRSTSRRCGSGDATSLLLAERLPGAGLRRLRAAAEDVWTRERTRRAAGLSAGPGNIRELANVIERAALFADSRRAHRRDAGPAAGEWAAIHRRLPRARSPCTSAEEAMRQHLRSVLEQSEWNISHAAARLGIARNTLYARLDEVRRARASAAQGSARTAPAGRGDASGAGSSGHAASMGTAYASRCSVSPSVGADGFDALVANEPTPSKTSSTRSRPSAAAWRSLTPTRPRGGVRAGSGRGCAASRRSRGDGDSEDARSALGERTADVRRSRSASTWLRLVIGLVGDRGSRSMRTPSAGRGRLLRSAAADHRARARRSPAPRPRHSSSAGSSSLPIDAADEEPGPSYRLTGQERRGFGPWGATTRFVGRRHRARTAPSAGVWAGGSAGPGSGGGRSWRAGRGQVAPRLRADALPSRRRAGSSWKHAPVS